MHGAIADFNKAISINLSYAEAYNNRGNAKAMLQKFQDSIHDFNMVITMRPDDDRALFNRGLSKYNLKMKSAACQDWYRADRLGNELARNALDQYCQGINRSHHQ